MCISKGAEGDREFGAGSNVIQVMRETFYDSGRELASKNFKLETIISDGIQGFTDVQQGE